MARVHQHSCRICERKRDEILIITSQGLCGECAIAKQAATTAVICGMIPPTRFDEFLHGFSDLLRSLDWEVVDSPGHKQWGVTRALASSSNQPSELESVQ